MLTSLRSGHKKSRIHFTEKHSKQQTNWYKTIFRDKKNFNFDGSDGSHSYWHDLRKEETTEWMLPNGLDCFSLRRKDYNCFFRRNTE